MRSLCAVAARLVCLAVVSASYPNPITDDELESVVTSSIDPFFYKVGSEVGTDKVSYSRLSDANFPRPVDDLQGAGDTNHWHDAAGMGS